MNTEILKDFVWENFPAQEIWRKDNSFWAFENKDDSNKIYLTSGYMEGEKIVFDTIFLSVSNKNKFITNLCDSKRRDGYECIAIQMMC